MLLDVVQPPLMLMLAYVVAWISNTASLLPISHEIENDVPSVV